MVAVMIERVEKAIVHAISQSHSPKEVAKAAIHAMREPTEAMFNAGLIQGTPATRWHAMIDAALKE